MTCSTIVGVIHKLTVNDSQSSHGQSVAKFEVPSLSHSADISRGVKF